jgi:hypothetical protein
VRKISADPAETPTLGGDNLGDDLLVDRVAVVVLVVLDEDLEDVRVLLVVFETKTSATCSGRTQNSTAPSSVIGKPSDERKSMADSLARLNVCVR